ncbi:MAG: hypothetical protein CL508_05740 [Actinobacteria bacterium]|nr:hypothetical protein [Actinomycetota bacterium]|tara:strand:+ start:833 stop:1093 length:261 start_codon:yes stop_codon:yes gene_type:complete
MTYTKNDVAPKIVNGEPVELSDADKQIIADQWNANQEAAQANQWKHQRLAAYASVGDQLDMQYWDSVNGTRTWLDHVEAVKEAYPK